MDLEKLSIDELKVLHEKTCNRLGWFPMLIVSISDVKDSFMAQIQDGILDSNEMPTDDEIRIALKKTWRDYDGGDWLWCVEITSDYAREYCLDRLGKKLTVLD